MKWVWLMAMLGGSSSTYWHTWLVKMTSRWSP
jgi:hypothetical protein